MNQADAISFCSSKRSTLAIVRNNHTLNFLIGLASNQPNDVKIWVFRITFKASINNFGVYLSLAVTIKVVIIRIRFLNYLMDLI
jgi:hypothetical protein